MAHSHMFWVSIWAHVGLIILLMGYSLISGCPLKKPKPAEVVTWVQMAPEPAPVLEVVKPPQPERVKPKPVEPEPVMPEPVVQEKIKVPEPPKPKLKKSTEIVKSKKKIKRTNEAPKPRPTPRPPTPKPLSQKEIMDRIRPSLPPPKNAVVGPPTDFSRFFMLVREKCYGAWTKPAGLASQTSAMVKIRVARNGSVTSRTLVSPSGNAAMDASVMKAANAVTYITPLPASYRDSYKDVTLEFKIGE